jgi:uncharacterized protein (DUF2461 family)
MAEKSTRVPTLSNPLLPATMALTQHEEETLAGITQEIPEEVRERYNALVEKRHAEALTAQEHEELISLSDRIEEVEVKRLEYLTELAKHRNVSLRTLMNTLNITSPSYA